MPVSISNFDTDLEFVAPAGGATAYVPIIEATTLKVTIPRFTVASGQTYTGAFKDVIVKGITKSSATAFLSGAALTIKTDGIAVALTAAGIINAYAAGPAVSTATTMDVLIVPPISVV